MRLTTPVHPNSSSYEIAMCIGAFSSASTRSGTAARTIPMKALHVAYAAAEHSPSVSRKDEWV